MICPCAPDVIHVTIVYEMTQFCVSHGYSERTWTLHLGLPVVLCQIPIALEYPDLSINDPASTASHLGQYIAFQMCSSTPVWSNYGLI